MKFFNSILFGFIVLLNVQNAHAQTQQQALNYLNSIGSCDDKQELYYDHYLKMVFKSRDSTRINKARTEYLNSVKESKKCFGSKKDFFGNNTLYKAYLSNANERIKLANDVPPSSLITNAKSYKEVKQYNQLLRENNQKVRALNLKLDSVRVAFAAKYNIKLNILSGESKKRQFLDYYEKIYDIKQKCIAYRNFALDAFSDSDPKKFEVEIDSLAMAVKEGKDSLKLIQPFFEDATLKNQLKNTLDFFEKDVSNLKSMVNFLTIEKKFKSYQTEYESIKKKTNDDINKYNDWVNKYNTALQQYQTAYQVSTKEKKQETASWEKSLAQFHRKHLK